jgi:putative two-component system response regulator
LKEPLASILVVDDDALVLESTCAVLLGNGFEAVPCGQSSLARQGLAQRDFDAVLSDVKMPGMTGLELLEEIRASDPDMPVVLMTAFADVAVAMDAIRKGAFDFILKPYKPDYLVLSMKKAANYRRLLRIEKNYKKALEDMVEKRTRELADALSRVKGLSLEIAHRLITVTEFRDSDTGAHVARIGLFTKCISEAMAMPKDFVETIAFASPMHDIGKIVVPDSILLKPGPLTPGEFDIIKTHTTVGERILSRSEHPGIQMAATIALCHHEKHDGSGYPRGLKGEAIPTEARITMLCDQYDALTSKRPYKKALSHEEAVGIIRRGDGRTLPQHFHPDILKAFFDVAGQLDAIRAQLARS